MPPAASPSSEALGKRGDDTAGGSYPKGTRPMPHETVNTEADRQALAVFVEECHRCARAREVAGELNGLVLRNRNLGVNGQHARDPYAAVVTVNCTVCNDTRAVLTEAGKKLAEAIRAFLPKPGDPQF